MVHAPFVSSSPLEQQPPVATTTGNLEEELRQAISDLQRGNYVEATPEQLSLWAKTGEFPWADESHD